MVRNTSRRVGESDLKDNLAIALVDELPRDALHIVTIGDGHDAGEIVFGELETDGFVLVRTEGHQDAWQGDVEEMAERFKEEVEGQIDGMPPEFKDTVPVTYSVGYSEAVTFEYERDEIDFTLEN